MTTHAVTEGYISAKTGSGAILKGKFTDFFNAGRTLLFVLDDNRYNFWGSYANTNEARQAFASIAAKA